MGIKQITLKNFRCFKQATFKLVSDHTPGNDLPGVTLIEGTNGSGKTSLLEALHYGCHLKSFRTHSTSDIYRDDLGTCHTYRGFTVELVTSTMDTITIGVADKRRVIKLNGTGLTQYDQLTKAYRAVTFIEDDLELIKGYPEGRRALIDTALNMSYPPYYTLTRSSRKIVEQRNKILQTFPFHAEQYQLWTDKLREVSTALVAYRTTYLQDLNRMIAQIAAIYGNQEQDFLQLVYKPKRTLTTQEDIKKLQYDEVRSQRTLFGTHLDDIEFLVQGKSSRATSSRGQQKLAIMFLKIAQARLLMENSCHIDAMSFLLDDFITDFDEIRVRKLLNLLFGLGIQLIITTPYRHLALYELCAQQPSFTLIRLDSAVTSL